MLLADAAKSRKERLLALRRKKDGQDNGEMEGNGDEQLPVPLSQRNFDPETRTLRKRDRAAAMQDTVENHVEGLAEQIISEDAERQQQELDLSNIAPKRPNWDLKREMQRKIAKLDRKTTDAIHTLIRQRIMAQKDGGNDLLDVLNAREEDREVDVESDDE